MSDIYKAPVGHGIRSTVNCRWEKHLPDAVKRAGAPSSQCCLFWAPSEAELAEDSASHSLWRRVRNSALGRSVRLAVKVFYHACSFFLLSID